MPRLPSFEPNPVVIAVVAACLVASATGCGSQRGATAATSTPPASGYSGTGFGGRALAGTSPIIGAAVQLYAAGTSGNGSGAVTLLTTSLLTDVNGGFAVSAGYLCPSAASQVYVVTRGGRVGSPQAANSAIALMTVLGSCDQIVQTPAVVVNEATTVAAVYALAQFLSPGAGLGASSTNASGLHNAVATAMALANIAEGTVPGPTFPANGVPPVARMNTVANLVNGCVVSGPAGGGCLELFSGTTPVGGAQPKDTLDAALNLVRNPAVNVSGLYGLSAASSAYAPALTAVPFDWTLFVSYTGGGMKGPSGVGIDGDGNVWVASYFNAASVFSPLGKPLLAQGITGFGLSSSYGLAVDADNHAWIPNEPGVTIAGSSVSVLDSAGGSLAGTGGFTNGGLDYPVAVAIDTDTTVWVVDYGNSHLTHLSRSGQALSGGSGYSSPDLAFPVAAAVDGSHNVWVANQSGMAVTKVAPDGSQFTNYLCCDGAAGLALDQLGNVWVTNYYGDSVSAISGSGVVFSNAAYIGGGLNHPQGIAVDGAGNVWISNFRGSSLTELAGRAAGNTIVPGTALSPPDGLGKEAALLEAYGLAVDASGNIWISNFGRDTLTQFVGLASPVRTPLLGLPVSP